MRVAVVSDIHDHAEFLAKLLDKLHEIKPDYLLLLGDYGAPTANTKRLLKLNIPTFAIW
jgi:predicted phosphodiesterase